MSATGPADQDAGEAPLSGTELALFGAMPPEQLRGFLSTWAERALGSPIETVRFRAGRVDAVWGVELVDGRAVVIKTHRPPVDLTALRATTEAQRVLGAARFPCALPIGGPDEVDGRVLTAETLITGTHPEGRRPDHRRLLADGLARHIDLLRSRQDLVPLVGPGPSWCRYQGGPWPEPHDTFVDLGAMAPGFDWLDRLGRRAADQVLADRGDEVVLGHGDWYAGNVLVQDDVLAGTFDWDLVADAEAVIVGFAAACYDSSSTSGGGLSTPEEAAAFVQDYEEASGRHLSMRERRAAAGATAWIIAFNARWQVALIEHGLCDEAVLALARDHGDEYLAAAA